MRGAAASGRSERKRDGALRGCRAPLGGRGLEGVGRQQRQQPGGVVIDVELIVGVERNVESIENRKARCIQPGRSRRLLLLDRE